MAASAVKIIVGFVVICQICTTLAATKCTIDVNKDFTLFSPLILDKHSLDILYPEKNSPSQLSFNIGQEKLLFCSGGELSRRNISTKSASEVSKCVVGQTFVNPTEHRVEYSFNQLTCSKNPNPETRENSSRKCKDGVVVDIGYKVKDHSFKRTIDLCYAKDPATTRWAHSTVLGVIGGSRNGEFRAPAFSKGSYFEDVLITKVYPKSNQLQTFGEIFNGDGETVERYLPQKGSKRNYLVKGHLVARADQFYLAEQYSTYFYLNVVPMWQSINNGNWKSVESTVRRVALTTSTDLDVWTGGIGVLKLSNKSIYLARDKKNSSRMLVPVPELLFKLVHNQKKNEALVFLTINNPYVEEKEISRYKICKEYEECKKRFGQFKQTFEGYTYCCSYEDFMASREAKELGVPVELRNPTPLKLY